MQQGTSIYFEVKFFLFFLKSTLEIDIEANLGDNTYTPEMRMPAGSNHTSRCTFNSRLLEVTKLRLYHIRSIGTKLLSTSYQMKFQIQDVFP